jgi:DNA polymerase III epsilon subunit-like protein
MSETDDKVPAPIVFFDIETGGLDFSHPVIQMAAGAVGPDFTLRDVWEQKVLFDPDKCDPEALRINHYDPEKWKTEGVSEAEAIKAFAQFLNRFASVKLLSKRTGRPYYVTRVGGHNIASFDLDRVRKMAKTHNVFLPVHLSGVLDTLHLASWHFLWRDPAPENLKLTTLAEFFRIPPAAAHDALGDVHLCVRIAYALFNRQGRCGRCSSIGVLGDAPWARGLCLPCADETVDRDREVV